MGAPDGNDEPDVAIIAACGENRVIGAGGGLPWWIPEDWTYFLETTRGGTLLMGRVSFEGLLPDPSWADSRECVVVTRHREFAESRGATAAGSIGAGLAEAKARGRAVWICGGEAVYRRLLPEARRLYLTLVHERPEGDTFFPDWRGVFDREVWRRESGDANRRYTFKILER